MGFADPARNSVIEKAKNEWVLVLDSDEEIPASLKSKIGEAIGRSDVDVWLLPRKNLIFHQWMKHTGWWPDYQYHLFRKGKVKWSDKVHTHPEALGNVEKMPAKEEFAKIHYNYVNVEAYINRLNKYTSIAAKERRSNNLKPEEVLESLSNDFISRYYLNQGYKDKELGLYLSLLQSFYEFITNLKVREMHGFSDQDVDARKWLNKVCLDLKYWIADRKMRESRNVVSKTYWRVKRKFRV